MSEHDRCTNVPPEENLRAEVCGCGSVCLHIGGLRVSLSRGCFDRMFSLMEAVRKRLGELDLKRQGAPDFSLLNGFSGPGRNAADA